MPLRDHFRSPINDKHTWDEVHGLWPSMIVEDLYGILPPGFVAAPNVHLGSMFEIDVTTFETGEAVHGDIADIGELATSTAPQPTLTLEADVPRPDEYEVRIYDAERERQLVAAIEIVSPSNKDRPENRQAFVAKIGALLGNDVCVTIVDLVTIRKFNLYADVLDFIGRTDPQLTPKPPVTYAVTVRLRKSAGKRKPPLFEVWFYPMTLGQQLPALPIWLGPDQHIMLPLESSYEKTCRLLRIG